MTICAHCCQWPPSEVDDHRYERHNLRAFRALAVLHDLAPVRENVGDDFVDYFVYGPPERLDGFIRALIGAKLTHRVSLHANSQEEADELTARYRPTFEGEWAIGWPELQD